MSQHHPAGGDYRAVHDRSLRDPAHFWLETAGRVAWEESPRQALDVSATPLPRWFPDGRLNITRSCLDRHVAEGRGEQTALIHDSPVTGTVRRFSYAELTDEVARCAGMLAALGVGRGDRVVLYLPMIPEAPIAMLACARLGAVHSVVFGGFAASELAARIDDAAPSVVLTASGGIEPSRRVEYLPAVAEALELAEHPVADVVALEREGFAHGLVDVAGSGRVRWHDWTRLVAGAEPAEAVTVAATDPLYILHTSGTTGRPKGVVRDQGGTAVALSWTMEAIYDVGPGRTMLTASDVGWVVGHSYIVYGPLLAGATTVLYEGKPVGTPDAGAFWRMVDEHRVTALFTAPTALRAIRKADPEAARVADHDLSSLEHLFVAGERLDPETQRWIGEALGVPVIDNWWQTETGWPIAANPVGLEPQPIREGSAGLPMVGYDVAILSPTGEELAAGEEGEIALRLPLPPGTLPTLWGDDQRFVDSYLAAHEGFYTTGDSGFLDDEGRLFVMGRTDDVLSIAGHRLSAGAIEGAVSEHPAVAECAVIGRGDELKGQRAAAYVVLKAGWEDAAERVPEEIVALVRRLIGPVAAFRDVAVVPALPKTRSGKILRRTMRQLADGREAPVPSTIEDPSVLDQIAELLHGGDGDDAVGEAEVRPSS